MTMTIVPSIQNMSGAPFSYGMSGFDSSSTLTYSTLQTIGLGVGSSNSPLQGSFTGTTAPFNTIPYGGGHIPPPSPSLGGAFQQPIRLNTNSSLFSGGSHGPQSYMTLVGSMPFSLFGAFGNNAFSSSSFSVGGNPIFGQPNPMQGFIPSQGAMTGVYSSQGLGNPWQGSFPSQGMSIRGKPLPHSVEPQAGFNTYARRVGWGHPQPRSLEYHAGRNPYTRYVIQLRESTDDAESSTNSFYWPGPPWFLPKPWPTGKIFLATWCQSKSRPLFSFESTTT
jgi:hypothetical protein